MNMMFPKPTKKKRKKHKKSIMQPKGDRRCYLCMLLDGDFTYKSYLEEHHVLFGNTHAFAEAEAEHCKFYSNKDMKKITATAMAYVTWHVTYFRDLRIYIRSLESKEDVEKVTYGMDIPEAYQSEPLKAMLAQKS